MNDNHKTSKGSHISAGYRCDKKRHHKLSKIYEERDMWCREGSSCYSAHRSHGWEHKIYRRVLRAKLKEEVIAIIKKDTQN